MDYSLISETTQSESNLSFNLTQNSSYPQMICLFPLDLQKSQAWLY